jgi:hypothetical protein
MHPPYHDLENSCLLTFKGQRYFQKLERLQNQPHIYKLSILQLKSNFGCYRKDHGVYNGITGLDYGTWEGGFKAQACLFARIERGFMFLIACTHHHRDAARSVTWIYMGVFV